MLNYRRTDGDVATIRGLIDRMAEFRPDDPCLLSPEARREWTYGELRRQSSKVVQGLLGLGLRAGDKVAFMMDNGLFTAGLLLGSMYGGFVPVPLNVRAGQSQLAYVLGHSDAGVVLVSGEYLPAIEAARGEVGRELVVLSADEDRGPWSDDGPWSGDVSSDVLPDQDALLMYTSGSTGQPKGAILSHRQILAAGWNSAIPHELSPADRSLCVLPLYHINADTVTLVSTLLTGGSVVMPHRFVVRSFWDWIAEYRCTWSALVPTIISQLLEWGDPHAEGKGEALDRIRFMRSSSAPLAPALHVAFEEKFRILLIEAMGSTECAGNVFSNPLPPGQDKIGTPGRPYGFDVRIVDPGGMDTPPGEVGEVYLRGPSIMKGYYKDPEGTSAVLGDDGWLRTGDLAYRDEDGYCFIAGRAKELIIKGGMNVAPRQIDEVLASHPSVSEAAALGVPDHHLGEDIVAFVVPKPGRAVDEQELIRHCRILLGSFKTPTRIHLVPDLPKGPSGKVQRLRLRECFGEFLGAGRDGASTAIPPGRPVDTGPVGAAVTPIQEMIAETWSELLKTRDVGVHQNFFALGGHSLLAIEILCRLRERFAIGLSLNDFFTGPTVAEQAEAVSQHLLGDEGLRGSGPGATEVAPGPLPADRGDLEELLRRRRGSAIEGAVIPPRDRSAPCPLSPAQERLWFLEHLHPGPRAYNEGDAVHLQGRLDVGLLERAVNRLIERHEALRTLIRIVDGRPTQVVLESRPIRLETLDLSEMPARQREAEIHRLVVEQMGRPYDLTAAPGIRVAVLRLGECDNILIFMIHHVFCDGWSLGVAYRELGEIYGALARGEPDRLPDLPLQYGDYAAWQRQRVARGEFAEEAAFWRDHLRGAPDRQDLPTDYPRPETFTNRGEKRVYSLGPAATERVRGFSRDEGVSVFMTLTAAFNALHHRYTGREDVVIGVPLANRDHPELAPLFGFLIAFQAMRTDLSGNPTFRELVRRVREGLLAIERNRAIPFDEVVAIVQPRRDLSRAPLFQTLVIWKDRQVQMQFMELEGLTASYLNAHSGGAKYDLSLFLTDAGDEIWLEVEYCTDLFMPETIDRLVGHFRTLLEGALASPEGRLDSLPLLTGAERHRLLVAWNETRADYPRHSCLHELFEAQARRTPERDAVACEGRRYTYAELNERADALAGQLRALGVGRDAPVGLYIDRSLEMVVGVLGILKAGGAYLPLELSYPADRLRFMIEDARTRVIATRRRLAAGLPPHDAAVVCFEAADDRADAGSGYTRGRGTGDGRPPLEPEPDSLAYILYTSGSTGRPKGVGVAHRAVVNLLTSMQRQPGLTADDTLLSVTTLSFDIATLELFLPLITGARVVVASREVAADGLRLARLLDECGATVMQATPATWRMLLQVGWRGRPGLKILSGGEALSRDLADRLLERCTTLWNYYGPTETTIWSSGGQVLPGGPITIGRPIANTRLFVLDGQFRPVPVGVAGELVIGGDGLARGYLNRPELTAERFRPDPFEGGSGGRLYRTGDLARWRGDGTLECLGRIDHQVKIRGHRVELGEIEAVLTQHATVREAVVLARQGRPGDERLVAYIVGDGGPALAVAELRAFLKGCLPDYMIPAAFVAMDALPLTSNGKIDRHALPEPSEAGSSVSRHFAAPRTDAEEKLAAIWAEALGLARVGIHDNFFELGGQSLAVTSLCVGIEVAFGRSFPLSTIFRAQTVAEMAALVAGPPDQDARPRPVILRNGGTRRPPLFLAHGMSGEVFDWTKLLRHLDSDRMAFGLTMPQDPDGAPLYRDLESLAAHHIGEMLALAPHGPIYILGYSFGGMLAFEIAQQLMSRGRHVALLGVFDTGPFRRRNGSLSSLLVLGRFSQNLYYWMLDDLFKTPPREMVDRVRLKVRALAKRMRVMAGSCPDSFPLLGLEDWLDLERLGKHARNVIEINYLAFSRYVPRSYPGRVTLFRARSRPLTSLLGLDLRWNEIAREGVEIRMVPGNHWSMMMEPHLESLAEQVRGALEDTDAREAKSWSPGPPARNPASALDGDDGVPRIRPPADRAFEGLPYLQPTGDRAACP